LLPYVGCIVWDHQCGFRLQSIDQLLIGYDITGFHRGEDPYYYRWVVALCSLVGGYLQKLSDTRRCLFISF
jgi:hypothetical protein